MYIFFCYSLNTIKLDIHFVIPGFFCVSSTEVAEIYYHSVRRVERKETANIGETKLSLETQHYAIIRGVAVLNSTNR